MTTTETGRPAEGPGGDGCGTDPSAAPPTADGRPVPPGGAPDAFEADLLPTPKGASRALLGSLLAPHRGRVWAAAVALLLQQAAAQASPLLVAYALDRAVPALRAGDRGPLLVLAVAAALSAAVAGGLQWVFVRLSARAGQDVLLDLRGRIFRHAQDLGLDFHERYTSGRLISRATTDVEALRELLEEGLQELVTVVLSTLYISALLLWLDLGLGVAALLSAVPLALLVRAFQRSSHRAYRAKSTAIAAVIVRFTETLGGIRPVQAFRREPANDA
ncbi:ABC transporter transmembrane domain-containing protein, partial [Streptomyces noursei]